MRGFTRFPRFRYCRGSTVYSSPMAAMVSFCRRCDRWNTEANHYSLCHEWHYHVPLWKAPLTFALLVLALAKTCRKHCSGRISELFCLTEKKTGFFKAWRVPKKRTKLVKNISRSKIQLSGYQSTHENQIEETCYLVITLEAQLSED